MPKASFIGFTGPPIESGEKNTPAVFGFPSPPPVGFPTLPFALSRAVVIDAYDILQSKEARLPCRFITRRGWRRSI